MDVSLTAATVTFNAVAHSYTESSLLRDMRTSGIHTESDAYNYLLGISTFGLKIDLTQSTYGSIIFQKVLKELLTDEAGYLHRVYDLKYVMCDDWLCVKDCRYNEIFTFEDFSKRFPRVVKEIKI